MADLKTTLGSLYTPEIEKALEGSKFVNLVDGGYVSEEKSKRAIETAKQTTEEKYKADAELWQKNKPELDRLQAFEATTLAEKKREKAQAAVREMLTRNNVRPGVIAREVKHINADDVKLDNDGKVTKEYEEAYMASFKADFPDGCESGGGSGAPARGGQNFGGGNPNGGGENRGIDRRQPTDFAALLRERHKN